MRRKSNRNVAKTAVTVEKPVEVSVRRTRRQSKRNKIASSQSSSEESDDGNTGVSKETVVEPIESTEQIQDNVASNVTDEPGAEQVLWKVTSSEAPSGEIQKLKFSLTKTMPSSPEKNEKPTRRRRAKTGSQCDEDVGSSEDITPRKTRSRGLSGVNVEEQAEEIDEQEEKKIKGKSKTKNRSKSEKTQHIQDVEDQIQSEISENVQVTPQSPQAGVNIRVDNESVSTNECETETLSVGENSNADKICDNITSDSVTIVITEALDQEEEQSNIHCPQECIVDMQENLLHVPVEEIQNVAEEVVIQEEDDSTADCEHETQLVEQSNEEVQIELVEQEIHVELVEEEIDNETVVVSEEQIETSDINTVIEEKRVFMEIPIDEEEPVEICEYENNEEIVVTIENKENDESPKVVENQDSKSESSSSEETVQANQEPEVSPQDIQEKDEEDVCGGSSSPAVKRTITIEVSTLDERNRLDEDSQSMDNNSTTSTKENTSLNLRRSLCSDITELTEESTNAQDQKKLICELYQSSPDSMPAKDNKWGDSLAGLGLLKPFLYKIDVNMFRELVPNLQLLDEKEIKIDIHENKDRRRSYSIELREKWVDRRTSTEAGSEDAGYKRLDTQTSINSETEEIGESEIDNSNIIAMNRKISIVDDTASKLKPPPSPAKNSISHVLYITNLVRPFTLKQLKELLERTGKVKENGFWTDRIKSKCYVNYETVEEAEATRNALHGVHWPIGNGKKLMIDYATEEDLEKARNPSPPPQPLPPQPATVVPELKVAEKDIQASEVPPKRTKSDSHDKGDKARENRRSDGHIREWDIGKENLHKLHGRNDSHTDKERRKHRRTPSLDDDFISRKHRKKEEDVPQKLMDDLFCRTKTTPNIYWLPLTPEEIATKQQQRLLRMAEHKRRMEESSRGRGDYGRGAPYRRRYD